MSTELTRRHLLQSLATVGPGFGALAALDLLSADGRRAVASELRSQGFSEAEKIRAEAERDRQIIIADAYKEAQRVKGEGDQKASNIYARAFGENPEFYSFYRTLEGYRNGLGKRSDVLVLEPNAEFFKYLKSPGKGAAK